MITYPLKFQVRAEGTSGVNQTWTCRAEPSQQITEIPCAIPAEFNGPGGGYSPEDLFALALVNCFIATFKVIAQGSKLEFTKISCESELVVDRNDEGRPCMKECSLHFILEGAANREKAERLLNKTAEQCLVWNSVLTKKNVRFTV